MKFVKFFSTILAGCFFISQSFAQGLEVSPVRFDFQLEAGNSNTQTLTVRNTTNQPAIYTLQAADWSLDKDGNLIRLEKGSNERSCSNWVSFQPALVELDANESMEVNVSMNVPAGVDDTKWSIVYVTLQKEQTAPQADKDLAMGIEVDQAIGVFITQSPRSNKEAAAKIINFEQVESGSDGYTFHIEAENKGDKILDCNMYLMISNLETAEEEKLEPITFKILPEGTRIGELSLPGNLAKGKYMVAAVLDYGPEYPLEGAQKQVDIK